jgi:hypothetical protein
MQAVAFCGSVKSVEIFNKRPDLDPLAVNDDPSVKKARKFKKNIIKRKPKTPGFYSEKKDQAITKFSPVYAIVDFEDDSAVEVAMR